MALSDSYNGDYRQFMNFTTFKATDYSGQQSIFPNRFLADFHTHNTPFEVKHIREVIAGVCSPLYADYTPSQWILDMGNNQYFYVHFFAETNKTTVMLHDTANEAARHGLTVSDQMNLQNQVNIWEAATLNAAQAEKDKKAREKKLADTTVAAVDPTPDPINPEWVRQAQTDWIKFHDTNNVRATFGIDPAVSDNNKTTATYMKFDGETAVLNMIDSINRSARLHGMFQPNVVQPVESSEKTVDEHAANSGAYTKFPKYNALRQSLNIGRIKLPKHEITFGIDTPLTPRATSAKVTPPYMPMYKGVKKVKLESTKGLYERNAALTVEPSKTLHLLLHISSNDHLIRKPELLAGLTELMKYINDET